MRIYYSLLTLIILLASCNNNQQQKEAEKNATTDEQVSKEIPRNQILSNEQQIAAAIIAAPKKAREEAKVYGYDTEGKLIVLREGSNEFICIADNPEKDGFQIVSYHTSLEPIMARGRALGKEGESRKEKEETRSSEAKSGILKLPESPATLHIYYGKDGYFDTKNDSIINAKYRYVVYIPYATQATTGLPLSPNVSSHPWLMFPGKYNAHIMITPTE